MSFSNFIPVMESKKLLEERDKNLVFGVHCTREYEGEIKEAGRSIVLKGIQSPEIITLSMDGTYTANQLRQGQIAGTGKDIIENGIGASESLTGYSTEVKVNQIAYWYYNVGDIDKELAKPKGLIEKARVKQGKALANKQDKHIASVLNGYSPIRYTDETTYDRSGVYYPTAEKSDSTDGSEVINVLDLLDSMVQKLNEQDVSDGETLVAEVSPKFWTILKKAYRDLDTNNSALLAGRKCGVYNDIQIYKTNNTKDASGNDYIYLRTLDSVAFFDPYTTNEPERPNGKFQDAVKGFSIYDAAIVDPKGVLVARIGYAE